MGFSPPSNRLAQTCHCLCIPGSAVQTSRLPAWAAKVMCSMFNQTWRCADQDGGMMSLSVQYFAFLSFCDVNRSLQYHLSMNDNMYGSSAIVVSGQISSYYLWPGGTKHERLFTSYSTAVAPYGLFGSNPLPAKFSPLSGTSICSTRRTSSQIAACPALRLCWPTGMKWSWRSSPLSSLSRSW